MKTSLQFAFYIWALFTIVFFPVIDIQFIITQFLYSDVVSLINNVFSNQPLQILDFSSDTKALYVLELIFVIISIIVFALLNRINYNAKKVQKFIDFAYLVVIVYLTLVFLNYGFDKVFKQQFYLPEPNILYTEFGNLSQDIAFWSLLGSSYSLNVLIGSLEVITAILLWFKKTRIVGNLLLIISCITILTLNLVFNISVKLFSLILLVMSIGLFLPYVKKYVSIFSEIKPKVVLSNYYISTLSIVGLILVVIYPNIVSNTYNDDTQPRPHLHGSFILRNSNNSGIKRVHFHRKNYIIFEDENNQFTDYYYREYFSKKALQLEDYKGKKQLFRYNYLPKDSMLFLYTYKDTLQLQKLAYRQKNILQPEFNWFTDSY